MRTWMAGILTVLLIALFTGCGDTDNLDLSSLDGSSSISVTTSLGNITGNTITDIPYGTTQDDFIDSFHLEAGYTAVVYDSEENETDTLVSNNTITITSPEGESVTYTIYVQSDPALVTSLESFSLDSELYTINNEDENNSGITITEGFIPGSTALNFSYDVNTIDYVVVPDSDELDLRENGTVEVVVYANSFPTAAGIVSKGESKTFDDECYGLQIYNPSTLLFLIYGDDGQWIGIHGSYQLQTGTWYHIIGTWDENTMYLYVNGVLDGTLENTTGGVRQSDGGLTIGPQLVESYSSTYGNLGWDGLIERVNIFNRTLSAEEVTSRYDALNLP